MLKTSMSDYEKSSMVTYPFYFINRQSIHKTNCMQRIKKILMREVFPAIALKSVGSQLASEVILTNSVLISLVGFCVKSSSIFAAHCPACILICTGKPITKELYR